MSALAAATLGACIIGGCIVGRNTETLRPVTEVRPAPEWEAVFTRIDGWTGADGAATVALPGGRVLWLFGDTFIGPVREGRHAAGTVMVNNTVAVSDVGPEPPRMISFSWGGTEREPAAWVIPDRAGEWYWPASGGVMVPRTVEGGREGERLVLFLSRIARRDSGESVWNFRARGTSVLVVDNPRDEPERWKRTHHVATTLADGGRVVMWGAGAVVVPGERGPEVMILGIDETNVYDKRLVMAKAPAERVEQFDTWRFWGAAGWSERERDVAAVADGLSSEISLHRMTLGGRECLVVVYSEGMLGRGIMARVCAFPFGAWSGAVRLYDCPEPLADSKLFVYSAKAHPEISRAGELLVSYCVNSTDFADVLSHAENDRPRCVRVPRGLLPAPP